MDLNGTSAVVVGGSSGLGAATAALLRTRGVQVVVVGRDRGRVERVAHEVGAVACPGDVLDDDSLRRATAHAVRLGPLRSVVVTAGGGHAERAVGRRAGVPVMHDLDAFRRVVETNLVGTFNAVRHAGAAMAAQATDAAGNGGALVLTSSLAASVGNGGQAAYAAAKAGLAGLLQPVAQDLSGYGIRVNLIIPGGFDTPIFGAGPDPELAARLAEAAVFPHRMGQPSEFASLAVELLTNDYINATAVTIAAGTRALPYWPRRPR